MSDHDDLEWLARAQPAPLALDPMTTREARSELLGHMAGVRRPLTAVRPAPVRHARERRWIRPSRVLAIAGVAAAVVVAATATGGDGTSGVGGVVGVDKAVAAPLVRLSNQVRVTTARPGDATLVLRFHSFPDAPPITGADLYLDDGTYYYAPTRAGLPARIAAHQTEADGWIGRITAAAVAALHLDIEQARTGMADAALDPSAKLAPAEPVPADSTAARDDLEKKKVAAAGSAKPLSPGEVENGRIWGNCLDALVSGGSRPDVRAGVLRLLASIPQVAVSETTVAGRPALQLDAAVFPDAYEEHLTIDAETGMPLRFTGGNPGQVPSVVMRYEVTRVSAAAIARG